MKNYLLLSIESIADQFHWGVTPRSSVMKEKKMRSSVAKLPTHRAQLYTVDLSLPTFFFLN